MLKLVIALCALLFISVSAQAQLQPPQHLKDATTVTPSELVILMQTQPKLQLIDTRPADKFTRAHIQHAINIPAHTIKRELPAKIEDKSTPIALYAQNASDLRVAVATTTALDLNYGNVYYFYDGIDGWIAEGQPVTSQDFTDPFANVWQPPVESYKQRNRGLMPHANPVDDN